MIVKNPGEASVTLENTAVAVFVAYGFLTKKLDSNVSMNFFVESFLNIHQ